MLLWSLLPFYLVWSLGAADGYARATPRGVGVRTRAAAVGDLVGDKEGRRVGAHRQAAAASAGNSEGVGSRGLSDT